MMYMINAKDLDRLNGNDDTSKNDWKLTHATRKRCFECSDRNKTLYQCSTCKQGICMSHSILTCNHCIKQM